MSYRFANSCRAGSRWNGSSSLTLLDSRQQTCMTYTIAVCTVKNSWWWAQELSETCRVSFQEWIWEINASVWFYYKKFNTMYGHMNVKLKGFISRYGVGIGLTLLSRSNERTLSIVPCKVNRFFYTHSRIIIFCIGAVYTMRCCSVWNSICSPTLFNRNGDEIQTKAFYLTTPLSG